MRYSIYLLLGFIYTLMAVIVTYVVRLMVKESRATRAAAAKAAATPADANPAPSRTE